MRTRYVIIMYLLLTYIYYSTNTYAFICVGTRFRHYHDAVIKCLSRGPWSMFTYILIQIHVTNSEDESVYTATAHRRRTIYIPHSWMHLSGYISTFYIEWIWKSYAEQRCVCRRAGVANRFIRNTKKISVLKKKSYLRFVLYTCQNRLFAKK